MEEYNFEIQYIKGRDNVLADALSRVTIDDLKQLCGESQLLAIARSMSKAKNQSPVTDSNNNNDINCNDIHVFEDFSTGFDRKVPRLKTESITFDRVNGTIPSLTVVAYESHTANYSILH